MKKELCFDGIILDVDGTIWNTTGVVAEAWNAAIEECALPARKVTPEMLKKEFGKPMDEIALSLWGNLTKEEQARLMKECCRQEHQAVDKNTTDIMYEGVKKTVIELSKKVNFYVVSNCQAGYIELMLKKTGLEPYVKDFECFGNTGRGKAENLKLLIERNGLKAPVYIGDTDGDCTACKTAEVPFIWASYGFGKAQDFIIELDSFEKLSSVIFVG